jgi:hypothetical protein
LHAVAGVTEGDRGPEHPRLPHPPAHSMVGVAKGATVYSVKVLDCSVGSSTEVIVIAAINYVLGLSTPVLQGAALRIPFSPLPPSHAEGLP